MISNGFGTLANLAKILEEAADPESELREDRREPKLKTPADCPSEAYQKKAIDPKRKAWYEKRVREQASAPQATACTLPAAAAPSPEITRKTAANASSGLLSALATARTVKSKDGNKRPEAWKRKPGDPLF